MCTLALGCSAPDRGVESASVRDSAGIRIVEHTLPLEQRSGAEGAWPPFLVDLGVAAGRSTEEFDRVTDAALGDGGAVIVANTGGHDVRAFRAGRPTWSLGRLGDGPGEFRGDLTLDVSADSTFVYDFGLRRLTVIGSTGQVGRTVDIRTDEPNPEFVCVLDDSSLVVTFRRIHLSAGLNVDTLVAARFDRRGTFRNVIATVANEHVFLKIDGGFPLVDTQPFTAGASVACWSARVAVAQGDDPQVTAYDAAGRRRALVRWPASTAAPMPSDAVERWRAAYLTSRDASVPRPARARWLQGVPIPSHAPTIARLLVAHDGDLWIETYATPGGPHHWLVIGPTGESIGRAVLPNALRLESVGDSLAIAVWQDEVDVEHVALFDVRTLVVPMQR